MTFQQVRVGRDLDAKIKARLNFCWRQARVLKMVETPNLPEVCCVHEFNNSLLEAYQTLKIQWRTRHSISSGWGELLRGRIAVSQKFS